MENRGVASPELESLYWPNVHRNFTWHHSVRDTWIETELSSMRKEKEKTVCTNGNVGVHTAMQWMGVRVCSWWEGRDPGEFVQVGDGLGEETVQVSTSSGPDWPESAPWGKSPEQEVSWVWWIPFWVLPCALTNATVLECGFKPTGCNCVCSFSCSQVRPGSTPKTRLSLQPHPSPPWTLGWAVETPTSVCLSSASCTTTTFQGVRPPGSLPEPSSSFSVKGRPTRDGTLSCSTDRPLPSGEWQACIRGWGLPQSLMIGCWMELRWMEHVPKEQDPSPSEGEEKGWVLAPQLSPLNGWAFSGSQQRHESCLSGFLWYVSIPLKAVCLADWSNIVSLVCWSSSDLEQLSGTETQWSSSFVFQEVQRMAVHITPKRDQCQLKKKKKKRKWILITAIKVWILGYNIFPLYQIKRNCSKRWQSSSSVRFPQLKLRIAYF